MQEDFRKQIKNEIRKWSMFHSSKKFNQLGDFHYFVDSSNWNDKEKMEEMKQNKK